MAALSEGVFTSPQFTFGIGENNVKVTVHAAAIAKQSQALDRLINGPMEEAQTRIARLEDVHEDTFVRVCQFAYTGDYETPVFIQRPESGLPDKPPNVDANELGEIVEEPEPERAEPEPEIDVWSSFGAKRQKKPKKSSKSRVLRDSFDKKNFDVETPRLGTLYRCEVRQNSTAEEDYTSVFLGHARLYVFADKWGIEALKTLSLHKLHKTLLTFTLYSARLSDVVELVRYTYAHTPDLAHEMDDLRSLVMEYLTCETLKTPAVKITAMPAKHVSSQLAASLNFFIQAAPPVTGWMLELGYFPHASAINDAFECGYRIYITGDTLLVDELEEMRARYVL
ncbi:hypothetical protein V500_02951 [Pseudogymnoascus sp. VKM F-4518 (FW-2643)]|nr:hypothetical protein V500_02951 [Pseudogymnoascus sp. VKM F-4518 (FW-2643)]